MFGKQIAELQLRKKALLLESDLNRLQLRADLMQLRELTDVTKYLDAARRKLGPWATMLAPLAGIAVALGLRRRAGSGGGWLGKIAVFAPALIRLWRAVASYRKEPK